MSSSKSNVKNFVNPLEKEAHAVTKKAAKALAEESKLSWMEVLKQTFGMEVGETTHADGGEKHEAEQAHQPNGHIEIFNFLHHQKTGSEKHTSEKPHAKAEAAIDYHRQFSDEIIHSRERASKNEVREMRQNIDQIKVELAKLVESSHVLKMEFAEVAVEQTVNVGHYQVNFFEWMLAVIRSAREKVEDSNAWLGTVKGKGAKKDYWGMFKKHGTTFGLSGERAVATSVG